MLLDNQINELTHLFKQNIHEKNAVHMTQYMKGQFLFLALKSLKRNGRFLGFIIIFCIVPY